MEKSESRYAMANINQFHGQEDGIEIWMLIFWPYMRLEPLKWSVWWKMPRWQFYEFRARDAVISQGMDWFHLPFPDTTAPDKKWMEQFMLVQSS